MFPPNSDAGTVEAVLARVTGHGDVRVKQLASGAWAAASLFELVVAIGGQDPVSAGKAYLKENLSRLRALKMLEQDGRCRLCPSPGPLQLDHIEERSRGRDDRPENLQLLCVSCHRKKTGTLQWKG